MSSFTFSMATVGYITDSSVHHSPKNFHLRRYVNEHLRGVERSNKTLSFRWGRNFRHFGLEAQATSNVPFKTFNNCFDSFLT